MFRMPRVPRSVSALLAGLALVVGAVAISPAALADKIHLRDGTVLDGTVIREEGDFYVVEIVKDGKKVTEFVAKEDVRKVEKDAPRKDEPKKDEPKKDEPAKVEPKKDEAKKDEPKKDEPKQDAAAPAKDNKDSKDAKARQLTGKANRVAFLNFGPPRAWQGEIGTTVGEVIVANTWREAIPLLEKDEVDTVVVCINSGGGYTFEMMPFNQIFQFEYKPRFRTVLWVESGISCAAMSPWPVEEIYFTPGGNMGGCTEWFGRLQLSDPVSQETRLTEMEGASAWAKRSPFIMRSMQIREPLSCTVNEDGSVDWFQDLSGKVVVNRPGEILTFSAPLAVQTKFAKGVAANPEELMKAMGINEYVIAGKAATDLIDRNMKDCHRTAKRLEEIDDRYARAVAAAQGLGGPENRDRRMTEIGVARGALKQMFQWMSVNPNFFLTFGRPPAWFKEQEEMLKELAR